MFGDQWEVVEDELSIIEPNGAQPIGQNLQSDRVGDDLGWILTKFANRALADEVALTIHCEGEPPELLARVDPRRCGVLSERVLVSSIDTEAALATQTPAQQSLPCWHDLPGDHHPIRALRLNVAEAGHLRVILTAVYVKANIVRQLAAEQMAKKLQPVLAGYFRLWLHARNQHRTLIAFKSALDLSDVATVILDGNGAVVDENSAARVMFEQKDVVQKSRYSLVAVSRGETAKLHSAMDRASLEGLPALISLTRRGYARPIMAVMAPTATRPEVSTDPSFILCIYDSEKDLSVSIQGCCDAYRLTRTESRLVQHLVDGVTIVEASTQMRIAEATARSYLKNIFSKTGTNRQTELVKLMLTSIARTSCHDILHA